MKRLFVFVLVLLSLTALASTASAQPNGSLEIANGDVISITRTEQPFVNIQFGNRGQSALDDVRISCVDETPRLLFNPNSAQSGPYPADDVLVFNTSGGFSQAAFPSPFGQTAPPPGITLPPGQNYNVGFSFQTSVAEGFTGEAGVIQCSLFARVFDVQSGTFVLTTIATDSVRVIIR